MSIETPHISKKIGSEPFSFNGDTAIPIQASVSDFWRWSASDLMSNTMRGVLAEYIVCRAIGSDSDFRQEWDAYDILTPENIKVEIKSSAYLQAWKQKDYSKISFGIQPTQGWDARTGEYSGEKKRQADVYIFCVLTEKNPKIIDPLKLEQWDFYVMRTAILNDKLGDQETLALRSLQKLKPRKANVSTLRDVYLAEAQASDQPAASPSPISRQRQ
ncbi:MAG: hypothetical protein ACR2PY_01740 [Salinispira sp.]